MEAGTRSSRLFVDVHVLQTVPPSCINRDDTGSPKTALYGGATRARVSSQCWKKAIRDMFKEEKIFPPEELGIRTKELVKYVSSQIMSIDSTLSNEKAESLARDTINIASAKPKKPIVSKTKGSKDAAESATESAALFFITPIQAYSVARLAVEWCKKDNKPIRKEVIEALNKGHGVDIALFGRMVAQAPDVNIDACVQVAHSISTHKVSNEYDFFTALDDLSKKDNKGAAHLDTAEYNSSTLYRYATVAVHSLYNLLGNDAVKALVGFVQAFVYSMPTGRQNSYANRTQPDAAMVTIRTDQPINLVGAFERPVKAGKKNEEGYVEASARVLVEHVKEIYANWLEEPRVSLVTGELLAPLGARGSFNELLNMLDTEIHNQLEKA